MRRQSVTGFRCRPVKACERATGAKVLCPGRPVAKVSRASEANGRAAPDANRGARYCARIANGRHRLEHSRQEWKGIHLKATCSPRESGPSPLTGITITGAFLLRWSGKAGVRDGIWLASVWGRSNLTRGRRVFQPVRRAGLILTAISQHIPRQNPPRPFGCCWRRSASKHPNPCPAGGAPYLDQSRGGRLELGPRPLTVPEWAGLSTSRGRCAGPDAAGVRVIPPAVDEDRFSWKSQYFRFDHQTSPSYPSPTSGPNPPSGRRAPACHTFFRAGGPQRRRCALGVDLWANRCPGARVESTSKIARLCAAPPGPCGSFVKRSGPFSRFVSLRRDRRRRFSTRRHGLPPVQHQHGVHVLRGEVGVSLKTAAGRSRLTTPPAAGSQGSSSASMRARARPANQARS